MPSWKRQSGKRSGLRVSNLHDMGWDDSTSDARSAPRQPRPQQTERPASSQSTSRPTDRSGGSATTSDARAKAQPRLSEAHRRRLQERKLDPDLCERLGFLTVDPKTLGIEYRVAGKVHNTKLRRGKGNMPWEHGGRALALWNLDCLRDDPVSDEQVIITEGEFDAVAFIQAGFSRVVSVPNGAQSTEHGLAYLFKGEELLSDLGKFSQFVLATDGDSAGRAARDALAAAIGPSRCLWVDYPTGLKDGNDVLKAHGIAGVVALVENAKDMFADEVATLNDIPEPTNEERYRIGIADIDQHGFRLTLPCLWALLGPYGSGKSVLARQIAYNLYREYGWRFMLSSFEEPVKPRLQRDLRRYIIGRSWWVPDQPWTDEEIANADAIIQQDVRFLLRPKDGPLTAERAADRIRWAISYHGCRTIIVDPISRIRIRPERGELKTDAMGDFLDELQQIAGRYRVLIMVLGHTSSAKTEKKLTNKNTLLTLNDGEDTRHWGGMSDIGWVMWRGFGDSPSRLHMERTKDHDSMGKPTLCELELQRGLGQFKVTRMGYSILKAKADAETENPKPTVQSV